jgi:hypothetical protein
MGIFKRKKKAGWISTNLTLKDLLLRIFVYWVIWIVLLVWWLSLGWWWTIGAGLVLVSLRYGDALFVLLKKDR